MRLIVLCITPTYLGTEPPASGPGLPYLDRVDPTTGQGPRLTLQLATPPGRHVTCLLPACLAVSLESHPTHVYNARGCVCVFMCSVYRRLSS
jgi:hypothetical protein